MQFHTPPFLLQKIFPQILWCYGEENKEIFLTFDDGPTPGVTEEILFLLEKYNAKATFFCLGKNIVSNYRLFEEILKQGHTVANHTYNHLSAWRTKPEAYFNDIMACNDIVKSNLFRPPYGHLPIWNRKKVEECFKIVMWSRISYDFSNNIASKDISDHFIKNGKPGEIWVFHDTRKASENCIPALTSILQCFDSKGFKFVSMEKFDERRE